MKRDYELIKQILIRLEELEGLDEDPKEFEDFEFKDVSIDDFYIQTKILAREKMIEAERECWITDDYPRYKPIAITADGMKFLSAAKNETVWAKLMSFAGEAGKSLTLAALTTKGLEVLSALLSS